MAKRQCLHKLEEISNFLYQRIHVEGSEKELKLYFHFLNCNFVTKESASGSFISINLLHIFLLWCFVSLFLSQESKVQRVQQFLSIDTEMFGMGHFREIIPVFEILKFLYKYQANIGYAWKSILIPSNRTHASLIRLGRYGKRKISGKDELAEGKEKVSVGNRRGKELERKHICRLGKKK